MVAQRQPMDLAAFMALPDDGNMHEFVRGEVRSMPPPAGNHGRIEAAVIAAIDRWLDGRARAHGWDEQQGLGARDRLVGFVAGGEFGLRFSLPDDPLQVRGADVVYVPAEQYAGIEWGPTDWFPAVPALVVEVISPSESAADVSEKVEDYLAGGAERVWCVYPDRRAVHIHDATAPTRVVRGEGGLLTDDDLLPDLSFPLSSILP